MAPSTDVQALRWSQRRCAVTLLVPRGLEARVHAEALLRDESVDEPPYWMHLWPGARVLAARLAGGTGLSGRRVLEIGCGLALPALVAARLGARVVALDRRLEALTLAAASARKSGVAPWLVGMDWRSPALRGCFDLCLGAEVGYDPAGLEALAVFVEAVTAPGGAAWFADSVNTHRPDLEAQLSRRGFRVRREFVRERDEQHPVWVRLLEARRGP